MLVIVLCKVHQITAQKRKIYIRTQEFNVCEDYEKIPDGTLLLSPHQKSVRFR